MLRVKYLFATVLSALVLSMSPQMTPVNAATNIVRINETFYTTFASAVTAANPGDTLYLLEDTTLSSATSITKSLTIRSEEGTTKKLTRGFNGAFFTVTGDSTLSLANMTIDGNKSIYTGNTGALVSLLGTASTNPTFTMLEGTTLTNNYAVNGPTAVQVAYGTFNMLGGYITGNQANLGIAVLYGADTSRALNLLGGEISGNNTGASSGSTGAIYAYQFGTITLGGNMVIRNNFKGTASSTTFGDLQIGTKTVQVTQDFTGEVYIFSDNHYQFGNVFGSLNAGLSIDGGHFYNNRNPYLHGEKDDLNQIKWDYSYSAASLIDAPTVSNTGLLRQYAYVDASGIPSTTIYRDISLPLLNPTDYTVSYDETTNEVTYVWNDATYGTQSFTVAFAESDLVTAKDIAKDTYADLLATSPSQAILDIVNTTKTDIDSALTVAAIIDILNNTEVLITNQQVIEAQENVGVVLWDYLDNPASPSAVITQIIDNAIDSVTNLNYEDTSSIISSAEAQLDAQMLIESKEDAATSLQAVVDALSASPSTAMQALESEALTAIENATSLGEVQSQLTSYSEQINALFLNETIVDAKTQIDQLVASLTLDPSSELLAIISEAKATLDTCATVTEVASTLTAYSDQIEAQFLQEHIDSAKAEIGQLVADLIDAPSAEVAALLSEAEDHLDACTDVALLSDIVETYYGLILDQRLDEVATLLTDTFNQYANENRHQYSDENLALLESIMADATSFFSDDSKGMEEKIAYLEEAIEDLTAVTIDRIGDFNPDDENFDETAFDPEIYAGVLEPSVPLASDARLLIDITAITQSEALYQSILNSRILPKYNDQSIEEIRASFTNQAIFSQINIRLVDQNDQPLPLASGSEYQMTLLLPEAYRSREHVTLVYLDGDEVQVFKTERQGNLISFTTDHFGAFYLLGDAVEGDVSPLMVDPILNLWWVIILEIVAIIVGVFFAFKKHQKRNKQAEMARVSLLPLALYLLRIIPNGAIAIIICLFVLLVLVGLYLLFLSRGKDWLDVSHKRDNAPNKQTNPAQDESQKK